jgi:hypothetical protein
MIFYFLEFFFSYSLHAKCKLLAPKMKQWSPLLLVNLFLVFLIIKLIKVLLLYVQRCNVALQLHVSVASWIWKEQCEILFFLLKLDKVCLHPFELLINFVFHSFHILLFYKYNHKIRFYVQMVCSLISFNSSSQIPIIISF